MNRRWIDGLEELIWRLHMGGMSVSRIREKTCCDDVFIRSVIVGVWATDGKGAVMRDAA